MAPSQLSGHRARVHLALAAVLTAALVLTALPPAPAGAEDGEADPLAELTVAFADHPEDARRDTAIRAAAFDPAGAPVTVSVETVLAEDAVGDLTEALRAELRAGLATAFRDEVARQLEESAEGEIDPEELDGLVDAAIAALEGLGFDLDAALDAAVADGDGADLRAEVDSAVLDAVDALTLDVTLAIADDAVGRSGTQLGGATTAQVTTTGGTGLATFAQPFSIAVTGRGFTLDASVDETASVEIATQRSMDPPDLTTIGETCCAPGDGAELSAQAAAAESLHLPARSDPSDPFRIWQVVHRCAPGVPCATSARGTGFGVEVASTAGTGVLALTASHEDPGCGTGYKGLPGAVLFDSSVPGAKTMTLTIDRAFVHDVTDNGRSKYDICMLGEAEFVTKDGTLAVRDDDLARYDGDPLVYGPGLLPDCLPRPGGQAPPCISSRSGGQGGTLVIVVQLPDGDPMFR